MLKTNKQIKKIAFTAIFALFVIPTLISADDSYGFDNGGYDSSGWGSWGGDASAYEYTPTYTTTPSYSNYYTAPSSYTPSYTPSYTSGGYNSYTPSYSGGYGYSTTPSYSGGSSSYNPTSNSNENNNANSNANNNANKNNNANSNTNNNANKNTLNNKNEIEVKNNVKNEVKNNVKNTNNVRSGDVTSNVNAEGGDAKNEVDIELGNQNNINNNSNATGGAGGAGGNATATTGSSNAVNNNVNNIYVYANPTGTAVAYNPQHQYLNVYCVVTPSNPRLGQTVTATAYATGGIGGYTYTWGGDIYQTTGPSTTFTSYNAGVKNINITARSGQEIITKSCDVVFENQNTDNNNDISAVCYANPTNATVNQVVTWTVSANGGNGSYSYNWSGTDGLQGNGQYISKQYNYTGTKNAYVTVSSNGRSVTANCLTNVNNYAGVSYTGSSVNLTPNITSGTPVSGVYLSQLPATGLSLGFVEYMVAGMVIVLAMVFTFIHQARKRLLIENI